MRQRPQKLLTHRSARTDDAPPRHWWSFWRHCGGATAIEYGLVAVMIAVAILATLNQTGSAVVGSYELVDERYKEVLAD